MKILVISDSHGDTNAVESILRRCEGHIDMCVFLGDGVGDAEYALAKFPALPRIIVRGNCDAGSFLAQSEYPDEALFEADGVTFLAVHGHRLAVKGGLGTAVSYAAERGADVLLYGHTHQRGERRIESARGTVTAINPGSAGRGCERTFALVETAGGAVVCGFAEV